MMHAPSRRLLPHALVVAAALAAVALTAGPAGAQASPNWRMSFPPEIAPLLVPDPVPGERVVVAALGPGAAEVAAAVPLVSLVVANSASTLVVVTPAELGVDAAAMDEAAVVQATGALGPSRLLVLRVLRPGGAQPPLINLLGFRVAPGGQLTQVGSVVVTAGQRPALPSASPSPGPTPAPAPGGLGAPMPRTAPRALPPRSPDRAGLAHRRAQRRYEHERLRTTRQLEVAPGGWGQVRVSRRTRFYQGESRRPLSPTAFYDLVERPELADAYRSRRGLKIGLIIGGSVAAAAGLATVVGGTLTTDMFHPDAGERLLTFVGAGIGVAAVGAALITTGAVLASHPVGHEERLWMADDFNDRAWDRAWQDAAPDGQAPLERPDPFDLPGPRVTSFGVGPLSGGLALALSGRF